MLISMKSEIPSGKFLMTLLIDVLQCVHQPRVLLSRWTPCCEVLHESLQLEARKSKMNVPYPLRKSTVNTRQDYWTSSKAWHRLLIQWVITVISSLLFHNIGVKWDILCGQIHTHRTMEYHLCEKPNMRLATRCMNEYRRDHGCVRGTIARSYRSWDQGNSYHILWSGTL